MKTQVLRAAASISGAALMTLGWSGLAIAAPGDVTLTASVSGNTVNLSINKNIADTPGCTVSGFRVQDAPFTTTPVFSATFAAILNPHVVPFRDVPNGNYRIYWDCSRGAPPDQWGTAPPLSPALRTAEPTPVTVGQLCFGSACLPSGSFGL